MCICFVSFPAKFGVKNNLKMITLKAYRILIGCFSPRFRAAISFMQRAYRDDYNDILLINRSSSIGSFLKVISVRLTTIFIFAMIILLVSGDIETNPAPYHSAKNA